MDETTTDDATLNSAATNNAVAVNASAALNTGTGNTIAGKSCAQDRDATSATRFFGVETEYPIVELDADRQRLDPAQTADSLMCAIRGLVPHLRCSGKHDVFTANGSRVYVDTGLHPEVATPECSTPEEAVLFMRAGDRLLTHAARSIERDWAGRGKQVEAIVWKANVDHLTQATWGSHESYQHTAPQLLFSEHLISHLVTRIIYTGAGGFDNRAAAPRFVVSPRVSHLKHVVSNDSTHARGVFHTRDQSLAAPPNRRLHVLAGESLWSETADYLRIGTTALLVAQIDAGRRPQTGLDLESPLQALARIATDVSCTSTVKLVCSGAATAIAIQRRLLESVEVDLGADHLPSWAPSVCARWRDVLDRLETSPETLVGVLDWPTKLAILKRQCAADGLKWTFSGETAGGMPPNTSVRYHHASEADEIARLLETDLQFTRLDDSGIFAALDRENALSHRIVSTVAVENSVREPPRTGRARIRAACVKRLANKGSAISCNWDRIVDRKSNQVLHLSDPFQSDGEQWTELPPALKRSSRDVDPVIAPIARELDARRPRQALARMHALLSGGTPISPETGHFCIRVIDRFVPYFPVPVLRHGGATVSPVASALFENEVCQNNYALLEGAGTLCYRAHEADGRYDRAAQIIKRLLARARDENDDRQIAALTNNLGYEHLLVHQWPVAENLFERALTNFQDIGWQRDATNTRANLLECRFSLLHPVHWDTLLPTLRDVNRALMANGDWRARKTLRLLARFAEHRGRQLSARGWMRRALAASEGSPTQLRDWDRTYLQKLETDSTPSDLLGIDTF